LKIVRPKKIGINVGLNMSSVETTVRDNEENKLSTRVVFGFSINQVSEKTHIRPELLFSSNGYRLTSKKNGAAFIIKERLNYIEISFFF
jgi:hypothetical protein